MNFKRKRKKLGPTTDPKAFDGVKPARKTTTGKPAGFASPGGAASCNPGYPAYTAFQDICCVCGNKFTARKGSSVKETRSDRKNKYHFCKTRCRRMFEKGLV